MYQQPLCHFGNINPIQLGEPAPLWELLLMALKDDDMIEENDVEKLEIAEAAPLWELLFVNMIDVAFHFVIHLLHLSPLTHVP
jgi:DNA mismatch repair protein MLH1